MAPQEVGMKSLASEFKIMLPQLVIAVLVHLVLTQLAFGPVAILDPDTITSSLLIYPIVFILTITSGFPFIIVASIILTKFISGVKEAVQLTDMSAAMIVLTILFAWVIMGLIDLFLPNLFIAMFPTGFIVLLVLAVDMVTGHTTGGLGEVYIPVRNGLMVLLVAFIWLLALVKMFTSLWAYFEERGDLLSGSVAEEEQKTSPKLKVISFLLLLYAFPVLLLGIWDNLKIFFTLDTTGTIRERIFGAEEVGASEIDILFVAETFFHNAIAWSRILEIDVLLGLGVVILLIGAGEGYSIKTALETINDYRKNKKLPTTEVGEKASGLKSKLTVVVFWLALLWSKARDLWMMLVEDLNFSLPDWVFPSFFEFFYDLLDVEYDLGFIVLTLVSVFVPIYVVFVVSMKLVGVSPVMEYPLFKTESRKNKYLTYLLTSTIIMVIFLVLAELLPIYTSEDTLDSLPLYSLLGEQTFNFIIKIFVNLETVGFYTGIVLVLLKTLMGVVRLFRGK